MLCAVAAVWLWDRHPKGWLAGAVPIMVSLGIYQSYVFTAVTLVMIVSILGLMNGRNAQTVLWKGIRAVGMLILGGIGYFFAMKGLLRLFGGVLSSGDYNSLDRMGLLNFGSIGGMIIGAYADWFSRLWNAYSS